MLKKCLDCVKNIKLDKVAVFAGGVLFGTAGLKVLGSKDAKKVYTQGTAAVLRAKDCVMKTTNVVQENAEDILAEAKQINEKMCIRDSYKGEIRKYGFLGYGHQCIFLGGNGVGDCDSFRQRRLCKIFLLFDWGYSDGRAEGFMDDRDCACCGVCAVGIVV